ncbi:MAG: hypothetical protein ACLRHW_19070 [Coprobacillus cateniformis]
MICYHKEDVEDLRKHEGQYYMPNALFDTMQYKLIRLEVKWAYVACLNVLLQGPSYDKEGRAFIKDDHPQVIEILKDLAHKKVDQEKIAGYLLEMEDNGLIERGGRDIYLKKICNVF